MGLVIANATFDHAGRQVRVGDIFDDSHELYTLFPSRFSEPGEDSQLIGDQAGGQPTYASELDLNYRTTDIDTATEVGLVGDRTLVNVGSASPSVAAKGSVLGIESSVVVANNAQAGAEHCALFAAVRYDNGTTGRAWLTDFSAHGAVATQQQILTGVNVVIGNYYNGQPSENPSCGFSASAGTGIGGDLDAAHTAATRYPNGDGYWVGGKTTSNARGWNYGYRAGGAGGPWNVQSSKLGYGLYVQDHDTAGVYIGARSTTGDAIVTESGAGPISFGRSSSLSTVMTVMGTFAAPASNPTGQMVSFLTSDNEAADRGASIGLGGATDNPATTWRNFVLLAGLKANSTSTNTTGYFTLQINKSGVGLQQVLRADIDGLLTLFDGGTIVTGSTTGTKIGTATTDKIGLYGVTPIAQRAGAAQAAVATTSATQTTPWGFTTQAQADAIVTLVNELRAWAVAIGAIKGSA